MPISTEPIGSIPRTPELIRAIRDTVARFEVLGVV
jgi:hypothetical protein